MLTKKGNSLHNLMNASLIDRTLTVHIDLEQNLIGDIERNWVIKHAAWINDKLTTGTRPAGTLEKELLRIEHHREQLRDAYLRFFRAVITGTTPQSRESSAVKAQREMLSKMSDRLLRDFAKSVLPTWQEYKLPGDKAKLVEDIIKKLRQSEDDSNGTDD